LTKAKKEKDENWQRLSGKLSNKGNAEAQRKLQQPMIYGWQNWA
jgi:hypothetical protein